MNQDQQIPSDIDIENEIRSDYWPVMTLPQLVRQQELVHNKINAMLSASLTSTPSGRSLYLALLHANDALSNLIEHTSVQPTYGNPDGKRL